MSFAYLFERYPSFVQTFCHREAEEMARRGMEPFIVSIRRPDDPPELAAPLRTEPFYLPPEKELRAHVDARRAGLSRPLRRALSRHRSEPDSQRLFEAIWLAPILKGRGLRHLHAHFGGLAARTAWWLRELFGFRYSYTGHANDIFCEGGSPISNALLVRGATFIVTETDYARRWMETHHPAAIGKTFRVFNGIATEGFPTRRPTGTVPRLISVGRYVEKKGFQHLIAACHHLRQRGLAFDCEIAGGGPLESTLRAQIEASDLADSVRLLGPRSQAEVRDLLAAADLFILACVPEAGGGSDNLPTVIMEAMAAGVPVISTDLAGVPEMITSGENGLLVPPGDPEALATAIARLLKERSFAQQLAHAALQTAREKFDIHKTTTTLKTLLITQAKVHPPGTKPTLLKTLRLRAWQRFNIG